MSNLGDRRRRGTGALPHVVASHGAGASAIQELPSRSVVDPTGRESFLKFSDVTQAVIDVGAVLIAALFVLLLGLSIAFCFIVVPLLLG